MNLKELGTTVAKYAPLLGSALPVPGGAAIGAIIAKAFGSDNSDADDLIAKITADPEARAKLLEIENKHKEELEKLAVQRAQQEQINDLEMFRAALGDKANARAKEVEDNKNDKPHAIPMIITCSIITGLFLTFIVFCYFIYAGVKLDGATLAVFASVVSLMMQKLSTITDYYFGSSVPDRKLKAV